MLDRTHTAGGAPSRLAYVAGALVTATVTLVGCTSARDVASSPSASPQQGGTLSVALALDAQPSGIFATPDRNFPWFDNVFEPLLRLAPGTREVQPVLATDVKVAPDGKSAKITLRDGVTFQDGAKLTADAVKFTFEKSVDPKNGDNLAFVAKQFSNITVDNPNQLTVSFTRPLGDAFLDYLNQTVIVEPSSYDGLTDGSKVVGTGPYSFGNWRPGAGFTLTKYDKYYDAKSVRLDKIEYVITTDPTAEINALKSGRVQIAYGMAPSNAAVFKGDNNYQFIKGGSSIYPLGLNVKGDVVSSQKVRQAIAYGIDYERLNQQVFAGAGTITNLPWSPGQDGVGKEREQHYTYDVSKAKDLIAQAGAQGSSVKITYNRSNSSVNAEYQIVANNLKEIGLNPVADGQDQPTYQAAQTNATIPQSFLTLHGQTGVAPVTLVQGLPTLRAGNASHMDTPEYQRLTAAVVDATDDKQRAAAVGALSDYMLDQAFFLTMVQAPGSIVSSATVGGVGVSIRGFLSFKDAYVSN
jgi:peptide/nickel transport system substrate-binding protein